MNRINSGGTKQLTRTDLVRRQPDAKTTTKTTKSGRFDEVLKKELQKASGVKFSAHAMDRIDQRKIALDSTEARKVGDAVKAAGEKGAKESLFIGQGYALIVNIPNKTVVTAMDTDQMKEAVVTNIDSTVIV
jgi:flagellar operon protein